MATSYRGSKHQEEESSMVPSSTILPSDISRSSFARNFIFGSASAAYQFEGAYKVHKQPSNWDIFTHKHPEKIKDRSNGDVAINQYNLIREDIPIMKDVGFDAYRFSISWSRIMNYGNNRGVNRMGIQHYNKYIDDLIAKGLKPFATLFHFDVPQQLEDEYGGFLDKRIVSDFQDYAEVCYKEFGNRVKHWITINEPYTFAENGYDVGTFAPGRSSNNSGNSATEPYIVTHNMILAHAHAVKLYKEKYQVRQKGIIGITLSTYWFEPYSTHKYDKDAAQRAQDFMFGWYMDPLTFGDYPESMKQLVGRRLPRFTGNESQLVKGSYDFLGLNYYTAIYAADFDINNNVLATQGTDFRMKITSYRNVTPIDQLVSENIQSQKSYRTDSHVRLTPYKNGVPIGTPEAPDWMYVYPRGIRDLLLYLKYKYDNPPIFITENGVGQYYNTKAPLEEILTDDVRINYHNQHLQFLLKAIKENVDVRGYFAWSLFDNFEWADGYTVGFGVTYVDLKTMVRHPKKSYAWFKNFLHH